MRQKNIQSENLLTRFRRRIDLMRLVFSLSSAIVFTVFTLIMLFKDWADSIYLYIVLGFILAYIVVFIVLMVFIYFKDGKLGNSLKDYKSGLKIMKAILRLISFSITVSVLSIAVLSDTNAVFRFLVLISSVIWAIFQIFYQIYKLLKRHKKGKKIKKGLRAKRLRKADAVFIKKRK